MRANKRFLNGRSPGATRGIVGFDCNFPWSLAIGFHADCIDAVARAAKKLGYSNMPVVSGAGHDAVYMAKLASSGMIFIPCKDGISHNEIEDAKPEHITAGCNVLLHAMLERAGT